MGFAIVELMGHRRLGGEVSEIERFGVKLLRLRVLAEPEFTQDVHPQALYAITDCTEEQARRANRWAGNVPSELQLGAGAAPTDDDIPFGDGAVGDEGPADGEG